MILGCLIPPAMLKLGTRKMLHNKCVDVVYITIQNFRATLVCNPIEIDQQHRSFRCLSQIA